MSRDRGVVVECDKMSSDLYCQSVVLEFTDYGHQILLFEALVEDVVRCIEIKRAVYIEFICHINSVY